MTATRDHDQTLFGLDDQDESVFDEASAFVDSCCPSSATFHILTPYPGTVLFNQFEEEGRLLHKDWRRYNHDEVVFNPKLMTSRSYSSAQAS